MLINQNWENEKKKNENKRAEAGERSDGKVSCRSRRRRSERKWWKEQKQPETADANTRSRWPKHWQWKMKEVSRMWWKQIEKNLKHENLWQWTKPLPWSNLSFLHCKAFSHQLANPKTIAWPRGRWRIKIAPLHATFPPPIYL